MFQVCTGGGGGGQEALEEGVDIVCAFAFCECLMPPPPAQLHD